MGISSWVQNKFNGKQEKKSSNSNSAFPQHNPTPYIRNEEFEDWPQTLLAIGTFGKNTMKEHTTIDEEPIRSSATSQTLPKFEEEAEHEEEKDQPTSNSNVGDDLDNDLSTDTDIILTRAKDLLANNRSRTGYKSLKFLLKKMFVCHSGFVPTPSLKEPLTESRMEKILRAMLHKKIYPHVSAQPSAKKFLEKKAMEEEKAEEACNKWVKTDSEYIVLEI